jgi:NADH-quinone oxidoreductase subunit M
LLGADAVSMWLVILTAFLTPLAIAASFGSIRDREKHYYAWMLLLLSAMLGVFVARDLLLFYIFFELTLVPMFFIIGIWGGTARREAAAKFFLFTFTGSVFTLAGAIYLGLKANTFEISQLIAFAQTQLSSQERFWIFLAFLAGFAVKVPLFPVHTWLPLAHTEAPTAGSVILAGVLLKLGTYGLYRFAVPIGITGMKFNEVIYQGFVIPPLQFWHYTITMGGVITVIGVLCVIGVIYGALVAWVQQDIKKLVAYSSVSHLGFCVLGLFALNTIGVQGSVLYMINHGLSTGALFLCIGMIYDRYHTRDIDELSGLAKVMPRLAFFFVLFSLSSIGLPGLNGFVSEFLTILGAFTSDRLGIVYGVFAALGIILGALYMLHMLARVVWGPLKTPEAHDADHAQGATPGHAAAHHTDIGGREMAILIPLALAVIVLGVRPNLVLKTIESPSAAVVQGVASPLPTVLVSAEK